MKESINKYIEALVKERVDAQVKIQITELTKELDKV
jgi:hypothetical protein